MGPLRTTVPTLQTRSSTPADLDSIVHIEERSFSSPWTHKMFETELTGNQFSHLWTAWSANKSAPGKEGAPQLIGYICFWVVFDEYRLMNLAVEQSWRRQGIAGELMRRSLASGSDIGARRALLEVRTSNLAAVHLYEGLGFRRVGTRERYYHNPVEDALLMELNPMTVGPEVLV
ncbi:MAG: ribosomal protein S18-alanine N-acetyltransferase [Actinobacteria bacterium]|nr:ribosomal protein S18-alanine N-acetyltransferase [Actinomycetota bacterium]